MRYVRSVDTRAKLDCRPGSGVSKTLSKYLTKHDHHPQPVICVAAVLRTPISSLATVYMLGHQVAVVLHVAQVQVSSRKKIDSHRQ